MEAEPRPGHRKLLPERTLLGCGSHGRNSPDGDVLRTVMRGASPESGQMETLRRGGRPRRRPRVAIQGLEGGMCGPPKSRSHGENGNLGQTACRAPTENARWLLLHT